MTANNNWPSQVVLQQASLEDLKLILSEAKDRVVETSDDAEKLYQRSVLLVSTSIVILTSIIGYVALHFCFTPMVVSLSAIASLLLIICCVLKKNITPSKYLGNGTEPNSIMVDGMFTNLEGKKPEWHICVHLIMKYDERSRYNAINNDKRSDNLKEAVMYLYAIPAITFAVYVLFALFNR